MNLQVLHEASRNCVRKRQERGAQRRDGEVHGVCMCVGGVL